MTVGTGILIFLGGCMSVAIFCVVLNEFPDLKEALQKKLIKWIE